MSNLLIPDGLLPRGVYARPPKLAHITEARREPMPSIPGAWISTERGVRRLLPEELAKGLGVPKDKIKERGEIIARSLRNTTSVFHWEYLSESLTFPRIPSSIKEAGDSEG